MFVNFSNHPSGEWPQAQIKEATAFGRITDIPFPMISATADTNKIHAMAEDYARQIMQHNPDAVMCQGEFTLAYNVITLLKSFGVTVVAACTERVAEVAVEDGIVTKTSQYRFVQFRKY